MQEDGPLNESAESDSEGTDPPYNFITSLPPAVRERITTLALYANITDEALLRHEARALLLYDAIYQEVDAEHDLRGDVLSRVIRSCIEHDGLPPGHEREMLLSTPPEILRAIESAHYTASNIETSRYKWLNIVSWDRRGAVMSRERTWGFYAYRWSYMPTPEELDDEERELINALIAEFGPIIPVVETRGTMGKWIYGEPIHSL